jgi:hypothetical protein
MSKLIDLTDQVFGNILVLGRAPNSAHGAVRWYAKCQRITSTGKICGKITVVHGGSLLHGRTKSCGCAINLRHGESQYSFHNGSEEWCSWHAMNQRVRDTNTVNAHRYVGRGIQVCQYLTVFENFIQDMGRKPSSEYSLDRKDNDGHYSCGHCEECVNNRWPRNIRWATKIEQANNKSTNRLISYKDTTMSIAEWSRKLGMSRQSLRRRIETGWTVEEAVTTPPKQWNRHGQR